MSKKREYSIDGKFKVREGSNSDSRIIEGYAILFGVRSRQLADFSDRYYEILEPNCLSLDTLNNQDIKLTMFHDRQIILARSNHGRGTLHYIINNYGVRFWAEMPKTVDGDKALELIKRGDINGCSFIYSTDEEKNVTYEKRWEKGEEITIRRVKKVDKIYDFTVTTDPAYTETTVTKREVNDGVKSRKAQLVAEIKELANKKIY